MMIIVDDPLDRTAKNDEKLRNISVNPFIMVLI